MREHQVFDGIGEFANMISGVADRPERQPGIQPDPQVSRMLSTGTPPIRAPRESKVTGCASTICRGGFVRPSND
jgi:hypothetical protein